jgi:tetratricopeptide (TPR) repeat protein
MRAAALLLALAPLVAPPAPPVAAEPAAALPGKVGQDFWAWLLEPHAAEVKLLLRRAVENRDRSGNLDARPYDFSAQYSPARAAVRAALLADAEAMLRRALALAPGRLDLLRELAIVTDENDRPTAQAALERYLASAPRGRASPDARFRLARWYARQRRFADAEAQLRAALGGRPEYRTRTQTVLLLSSVLMHTGRLSDAIELLRGQVVLAGPGGAVDPLTMFALAVAYDRDEQISLARDALARIVGQGNGNDQLMNVLFDGNLAPNRNPLVPPVERRYFAALQYEALGFLPEARLEWQAYAAEDDAPYRARAAQHIASIDRLLEAARLGGPAPAAGRPGGP